MHTDQVYEIIHILKSKDVYWNSPHGDLCKILKVSIDYELAIAHFEDGNTLSLLDSNPAYFYILENIFN